jgi:hypothetical protein
MGWSAMISIILKTLKPHKDMMNKRRPYEDFNCPKCGAKYKLVRMPTPVGSCDFPLYCKICSQEFPSKDEESILKYFLVGQRPRSSPSRAHG